MQISEGGLQLHELKQDEAKNSPRRGEYSCNTNRLTSAFSYITLTDALIFESSDCLFTVGVHNSFESNNKKISLAFDIIAILNVAPKRNERLEPKPRT